MKWIKNKVCFGLGILIAVGGIGFWIFLLAMTIWYGAMMDAEIVFHQLLLIGLPILAGIVLVVAGLREQYRRRIILVLEWAVFLVYLIMMSSLLFGGYRIFHHIYSESKMDWRIWMEYNTNFIPFHSIGEYINNFIHHSMNYDIILDNLFGNLILFMPMAVFLPCLFSRMYKWRYLVPVMAIIIIAVEAVQLVFQLGSMDVDDFILNFSGAMLAFGFLHIPAVKRLLQRCYLI